MVLAYSSSCKSREVLVVRVERASAEVLHQAVWGHLLRILELRMPGLLHRDLPDEYQSYWRRYRHLLQLRDPSHPCTSLANGVGKRRMVRYARRDNDGTLTDFPGVTTSSLLL